MVKITPNALEVVKENFQEYKKTGGDNSLTLLEWVELEAESDPNFFRWLFNARLQEDFDSSITEEHEEIFNEFKEQLKP